MNTSCDLTLAPSELQPTLKEDTKDSYADVELKVGMPKGMDAPDLPSSLVLQAGICLLQSMVVGVGVHAGQLHSRTTTAVATLLHHIVHCGNNKGLDLLKELYTYMYT